MKILFFDIETVPSEQGFKHGKPRGPEETEEAYLKRLSLSALTARIVCLGYALEPPVDAAVEVLSGEEPEIVRGFWTLAGQVDLFVGHNLLDFDLRFLYQRSVIHRVKPSREIPFTRFRNAPVYDTMHEWTKWGREGVKLDSLALALELPSPKDGMDGSKVYDAFVQNRIDEICEYCRGDVETVRRVYRRMRFLEGT